ncbi:hypothetical protein PIB30_008668 [Stylosanthes scabra]|uniref:Sieve element occlusion C-terminal domain-containing protein n=1 Tax=Stylosanthes scabra TaxID=79078 RepID=A0ABU6T4T2_9FABA|nr:hypothetical protein [Stylosanthes scabra]
MRTEKGWALVSKGQNVLLIGCNEVMMSVVEGFENWRTNVSLDIALKDYYDHVSKSVNHHCVHFQSENIRSGVPAAFECPDPTCGMKMEIESDNAVFFEFWPHHCLIRDRVSKEELLQGKGYKAFIENQTGYKIKTLQIDNGKEIVTASNSFYASKFLGLCFSNCCFSDK